MRSAAPKLLDSRVVRIALGIAAVMTLGAVYLFQRVSVFDLAGVSAGSVHPNIVFIVNRALRLVVNDLACFVLIFAIFRERKYLKLAFWVFLVEFFIILPVYLAVKLTLEGDSELSSPFLSQVHRLIVNPTLMILLMVGFFYQRMREKRGNL